MTEMTKLFDDIEMPLCEVLASMEFYGVKADAEGIKAFGEDLKIKIDELTSQIYMYAGKEFNIASTKQLGDVLFEDLGLPAKKKQSRAIPLMRMFLKALWTSTLSCLLSLNTAHSQSSIPPMLTDF